MVTHITRIGKQDQVKGAATHPHSLYQFHYQIMQPEIIEMFKIYHMLHYRRDFEKIRCLEETNEI